MGTILGLFVKKVIFYGFPNCRLYLLIFQIDIIRSLVSKAVEVEVERVVAGEEKVAGGSHQPRGSVTVLGTGQH